jgi:hypothetical protein
MGGHRLDGLVRWSQREPWADLFGETFLEHIVDACECIGLKPAELDSAIDASYLEVLWECAFEDFVGRDHDDVGNIVEDYLKRRGLRETATTRAFMQVLRRSVMSLYEVSDIQPGVSFLARDLIRGGEPVPISERIGSRNLRPWDVIAMRVLDLGHRVEIGGGVLHFSRQEADSLIEEIAEDKEEVVSELLATLESTGQDFDRDEFVRSLDQDMMLKGLAPVFTDAWLEYVLASVLEPVTPEIRNTDGHDMVFTEVRYQLRPRVTAKTLRPRLNTLPEFVQEELNQWSVRPNSRPRPLKRRSRLRGRNRRRPLSPTRCVSRRWRRPPSFCGTIWTVITGACWTSPSPCSAARRPARRRPPGNMRTSSPG